MLFTFQPHWLHGNDSRSAKSTTLLQTEILQPADGLQFCFSGETFKVPTEFFFNLLTFGQALAIFSEKSSALNDFGSVWVYSTYIIYQNLSQTILFCILSNSIRFTSVCVMCLRGDKPQIITV